MSQGSPPSSSESGPASLGGRVALLVLPAIAALQALLRPTNPQDDAFISFRYAENLLLGEGLVYNVGEWVEGYTNLLWTLMMATAMGLNLDPIAATEVFGVASLAALALGVAWVSREAMGELGWLAAWVAGLLIALDLQAGLEAVQGLESTFYALLVAGGGVLAVHESRRDTSLRHLGSTVLFGAAVLTRPEAPLHAALIHLGILLASRDRRSQLVASLAAGVGVAAVLGALIAWRLSTYGYPFPNTYYAKTGGLAVARGLRYLWAHALDHPALWGLFALRPLFGRRTPWTAPATVLCLGHLSYVVAVGGDFKPTGRFVLPVLAPMALLGAEALVGLVRDRTPVLRGLALLTAATALLLGTVRLEPKVAEQARDRHGDYKARRMVGEYLAASFPTDTVVAIHSAGVIPFYSRLPTIDMWGLTDAHIARAPVPDFGEGLAGHERSDPDYVFGREPDLYLPEDHLLARTAHELEPGPGFPADFTERYHAMAIKLDGGVLNLWVKKGFLRSIREGTR